MWTAFMLWMISQELGLIAGIEIARARGRHDD